MVAPPSNNMPRNVLSVICLVVSFSHVAALSNLSGIEKMLFSSRLTKIHNAVASKFQSSVGPQLIGADTDGTFEQSARDVTIIFPGAGGRDAISDELEESLRQSSSSTDNSFVTTFDWQEHRGTVLTAAYDSETVGETVGKCLWEVMRGQLRSVHCVGISVGAFAANGMAREICVARDGEPSPYVRLTLLAPFTSRGVTGSSYGPDNFGEKADYAVQYMTKEDPVPTTDKTLPQCTRYDITSSKTKDDFVLPDGESMHCWPVAYYARHGLEEERARFGDTFVRHDDGIGLERGAVVKVE